MLFSHVIILLPILSLTKSSHGDVNDVLNLPSRNLPPVSQICIGCMCEVMSGCKEDTLQCEYDVCGPFRMTKWYWADAEKRVASNLTASELSEFETCANDVFCASDTVQEYMNMYKTDCNKDNNVDCFDFLAIHNLGSLACGDFFTNIDSNTSVKRLKECLDKAKANESRQKSESLKLM